MVEGREIEVAEIEDVCRKVRADLGEGPHALPFEEHLRAAEAVPERRQLSIDRHVTIGSIVRLLIEPRAVLVVHSLPQRDARDLGQIAGPAKLCGMPYRSPVVEVEAVLDT